MVIGLRVTRMALNGENEMGKEECEGPNCRICLMNDSEECLTVPCECKGSVGHVHASCLSRWRAMNGTVRDQCTTCGSYYQYSFYDLASHSDGISYVLFALWLYGIDAIRLLTSTQEALELTLCVEVQFALLSMCHLFIMILHCLGNQTVSKCIRFNLLYAVNMLQFALGFLFPQWHYILRMNTMAIASELIRNAVRWLLGQPCIVR